MATVAAEINADVSLLVISQGAIDFDCVRNVRKSAIKNADTALHIPYTFHAVNPSEISIGIQKGALTDTFEMTTPLDLPLESSIQGKLLDFAYQFLVYESSASGLMHKITGMYPRFPIYITRIQESIASN